MSYLDQVIARADSPATLFIGSILFICLVAQLLSSNKGGDE